MNFFHNLIVLLKFDRQFKQERDEAIKEYKESVAESKRINETVARVRSVKHRVN